MQSMGWAAILRGYFLTRFILKTMTEQTPKCAFCGKHKDEVKHLIEGDDNTFICNE